MIIKNVKVYQEDQTFKEGEICIRDGVFAGNAEAQAEEEILDGAGCYAIPGMIDLHFHGCMGYDFCDGTEEAIREIARYEASIGVTAIAPATMTLPVPELEHILSVAAAYRKKAEAEKAADAPEEIRKKAQTEADLVGVNMEGPFISKAKKGAQDERNIIPCDAEIFRRFQCAADGLVRFIGIAPEEPGATTFVHEVKDEVNVSLAHTNSDYAHAMAAFEAGANHAVHLYNAIPAIYNALGIYLPLITTNCAVLGVALTNVQDGYNFIQSVTAGFGTAVGYTISIVLLAGIRERIDEASVPLPFRGAPVVLLSAALMSIAFMGFAGLSL